MTIHMWMCGYCAVFHCAVLRHTKRYKDLKLNTDEGKFISNHFKFYFGKLKEIKVNELIMNMKVQHRGNFQRLHLLPLPVY